MSAPNGNPYAPALDFIAKIRSSEATRGGRAADYVPILRGELIELLRHAEAAGRAAAAECSWPGDRAATEGRVRWVNLLDALGISPEEMTE